MTDTQKKNTVEKNETEDTLKKFLQLFLINKANSIIPF